MLVFIPELSLVSELIVREGGVNANRLYLEMSLVALFNILSFLVAEYGLKSELINKNILATLASGSHKKSLIANGVSVVNCGIKEIRTAWWEIASAFD